MGVVAACRLVPELPQQTYKVRSWQVVSGGQVGSKRGGSGPLRQGSSWCPPAKALLQMHFCQCTPAIALLPMHSCSCTPGSALLQMHSWKCTPAVALLPVHSCICAPADALLEVHSFKCTPAGALLQVHSWKWGGPNSPGAAAHGPSSVAAWSMESWK